MPRILPLILCAVAAASTAAGPAAASDAPAAMDAADRFGALVRVNHPSLSPDGHQLAFVVPGPGPGSTLWVADLEAGKSRPVATSDGAPMRLESCHWSGVRRLVCLEIGLAAVPTHLTQYSYFTRLVSFDPDGHNLQTLGQRESEYNLAARQEDGEVIDWLDGADETVLLSKVYIPEKTTGRHYADTRAGLGVERLDTRTLKTQVIESPRLTAGRYVSDGHGEVRLMDLVKVDNDSQQHGEATWYYRPKGSKDWQELGHSTYLGGLRPLAVDAALDCAYVLEKLDGRWALYRIALDGSLRKELVVARPDVDVQGVATAGRSAHVIGAAWSTDYEQVEYFDPTYRKLAEALAKAIPDAPLVRFIDASADEQVILLEAGSDRDPGHYYVFDRRTHQLDQVAAARPQVEGLVLAEQKPVEFAAADGTKIPGYLTLPPGVKDPKGLPALVMPHGGPNHRDAWGYDWLPQFFAHQGYAVLQPNFRGSAGYGDAWFKENGFKSWRLAVGDTCAGAHWLVDQGIADPARLAIFGWSYGGYVALQANVLEPKLFRATIAVAPVTDFGLVKDEAARYATQELVEDFVGSGPHIAEGSPRRHAEAFVAPVLMFHGERDQNVTILQSREMDNALVKAGKRAELVEFPMLDHYLEDGQARALLLRRSDDFLKASFAAPAAGGGGAPPKQ